jgi:hypothetical protein
LQADDLPGVRVLPAADYCCFTPASKEVFWPGEWKITAQSDRYGYRLAGTALEFVEPVLHKSPGARRARRRPLTHRIAAPGGALRPQESGARHVASGGG